MDKSCKKIVELLVDYADGDLTTSEAATVSEHLASCPHCRELLDGLQKSLCLADVVWKDGLAEIQPIQISATIKTRKVHWARYTAIAATILIAVASIVVRHQVTRPVEKEMAFAEIEQRISQEGNAARLLAAAEMLAKYPDAEAVSKQQYRYIAESYPQTQAAAKARLLMK